VDRVHNIPGTTPWVGDREVCPRFQWQAFDVAGNGLAVVPVGWIQADANDATETGEVVGLDALVGI